MAVRSRSLEFVPRRGFTTVTNGFSNVRDQYITGKQRTVSEETGFKLSRKLIKDIKSRKIPIDPWYAEKLGQRDYGSEFNTLTNFYHESPGQDLRIFEKGNQSGSAYFRYNGPWRSGADQVSGTDPIWPRITTDMRLELFAKGAVAISKVLPTNPAASLGVALGELREGVPSLIGSQLLQTRARDFRKVGSEYLNVEFGWKPLISDVTDAANAVRNSKKLLDQYERDSGNNVRRSYHFPDEESTSISYESPRSGVPTFATYAYGGPLTGVLEVTRKTLKRTWFSGCFTYHLASGQSAYDKMKRAEQQAARLLGLRITPDLLYQLTPWSWLADWNSNLGDVIRNVSAFSHDGLVMRWGYIMCEYTMTSTYQLRGVTTKSGAVPLVQTFGTTQKVRYRATPYGFGLDTAAFTPRQWAILAALGISKGPRQL